MKKNNIDKQIIGDPRDSNEALENSLNPFRITKNSLKKCICGHTVGLHRFDGSCKASIFTPSCPCKEIKLSK